MREGQVGIITYSVEGHKVAQRILQEMPKWDLFVHSAVYSPNLGGFSFSKSELLMKEVFHMYACWIFVGPCGVAVRSIAPFLKSKLIDPAVLVVDVGARHVVSLLSGHEGGANTFAVVVSNIIAAEPVLSTTTDVAKTWIAGIGCRNDTLKDCIKALLIEAMQKVQIEFSDIRFLASATLKKQEPGLLELAQELEIPVRFFYPFQINSIKNSITINPFVMSRVGLPGVAEPTALLAGRRTQLCVQRIARNGVTIALAKENCWWWESAPEVKTTEPIEP